MVQEESVPYGSAVTESPLEKCRAHGMELPADLEMLAMQRGCDYYSSSGEEGQRRSLPEVLSNAELAVALLSPQLPTTHRLVRIGAMVLSAPDVDPVELVKLAHVEGCAGVLRHIADAGVRYEPELPFWRMIVNLLDDVPPEGPHLPHPTRFIEMSAISRGRLGLFTRWLRARPLASV